MKGKLAILVIVVLSAVSAALAQQQPSPAMAAANALMSQQKYAEAADAYDALLKAEPTNGAAWYQLGVARYSLKQYPAAAGAFEKNIPISGNGIAMYNLACVYSLMGERDKAIDWLTRAVNDPKTPLAFLNFDDPDLANVHGDPRFAPLAEKADRVVRPCMYSDAAKQLNFWVGEWDVYNPQGRKDGTSSIQSFASGCGVLENWTGAVGGGGKSINFYDEAAGKWFQYWIGANGGPQRYAGVYRDGALRYEGESIGKDGKKTLLHLTFFNVDANTVRQLAENSTDDGKTWTIRYDYKYVRRKP